MPRIKLRKVPVPNPGKILNKYFQRQLQISAIKNGDIDITQKRATEEFRREALSGAASGLLRAMDDGVNYDDDEVTDT